MPIDHYGLLCGRPVTTALDEDLDGGYHLNILLDVADVLHTVAVNVFSAQAPHGLLMAHQPDLETQLRLAPLARQLLHLPPGRYEGQALPLRLDYQRSALVGRDDMQVLPYRARPSRPTSGLFEQLSAQLWAADTQVLAFGSLWGPDHHQTDRYFGFTPANGMHNVHMNQGNQPPFQDDNGAYQDGALFLRRAGVLQAFYLAFQSQTWTGNQA